MIHLLIDNCSLLQIVNAWGYNTYISQIENLINEKKIKLYNHDVITEEWLKHKPRDFDRKLENRKKKSSNPNGVSSQHISEQYNTLDRLLKDAELVPTPEIIFHEVGIRKKNNLAPFLNGKDSFNDWLLLGSIAHHCQVNNQDLLFLSNNHRDFGNNESEIHTDLTSRFDKIKIRLYNSLVSLVSDIESMLGKTGQTIPKYYPNQLYTWRSTLKGTILDSLSYIFLKAYKNVEFIPTSILVSLYPFSHSDRKKAVLDNAVVTGVHNDLITFLSNINFAEGGEISFKDASLIDNLADHELVQHVINKLRNNLLYGFRTSHAQEPIYIIPPSQTVKDFSDPFVEFRFCDIEEYSPSEPKTVKILYKEAFYAYRVGDLGKAQILYTLLKDQSILQDNRLLHFFGLYNLKQITRLLGNPLHVSTDNTPIEDDLILENLDLYQVAIENNQSSEFQVMLYLATNNFFNDSFESIANISSSLDSKFYTKYLASFHNSSSSLVQEFLAIESFLDQNYLIFDLYSDFERLFDHFLKGIFSSYALPNNHHGNILQFDDELVRIIIRHGSDKSIINYANRYNISKIRYEQNGAIGRRLLDFSNLILVDSKNISTKFAINFDSNIYFKKYYEKCVKNLIVLSSLLDVRPEIIEALVHNFIDAIETNSLLKNDTIIPAIRNFISLKFNHIEINTIVKFVHCIFQSQEHFDPKLLLLIVKRLPASLKLEISFNEAIKALNYPSKIPGQPNLLSKQLFVNIYSHVDSETRDCILIEIQERTKDIDNFDYYLFIYAAIHDIKKVTRPLLLRTFHHLDKTTPIFNQNDGFSEIRVGAIDNFLNLVFKYRIVLNSKIKKRIASVSSYYDWLVNIDSFDYNKFKATWLREQETLYYQKHFKDSLGLRNHMETFLAHNVDKDLAQLYVQFYIRNKLD